MSFAEIGMVGMILIMSVFAIIAVIWAISQMLPAMFDGLTESIRAYKRFVNRNDEV